MVRTPSSRKVNRRVNRKTTFKTPTNSSSVAHNKHSRRTAPTQQTSTPPPPGGTSDLGPPPPGGGSLPGLSSAEMSLPGGDLLSPVNDVSINEFDPIANQVNKQSTDQDPTYQDPTYNKETKNYTSNVYFKNLHGKNETKSVPIKTKFKPTDQQLRMLGAMELQKDGGTSGHDYIAASEFTTRVSNKNYTHNTNSVKYHGNTFKHISNQAGDYMRLSSDGFKKGNSNSKITPKVDKNKNPVFEKRDSGYNPPKYGDRGLTGIGGISLTGFAGGVHKKGSKNVSGKRRTEDTPFSFNWEEPRRSGYERVKNSDGITQWMGGLKKNQNTGKILKQQKENRTDKLKRNKKGEIIGAMKRFKNKGSKNKESGVEETEPYGNLYNPPNPVIGTESWSNNDVVQDYLNLDGRKSY